VIATSISTLGIYLADTGPVQARDAVEVSLLCILLVGLYFIGRRVSELERRVGGAPNKSVQRRDSGGPRGASGADEIDSVTLAVISAAVYAVLEGQARIVSSTIVDAKPQAWSEEGRRQQFQSHHVR
jgi:hypothetical protein